MCFVHISSFLSLATSTKLKKQYEANEKKKKKEKKKKSKGLTKIEEKWMNELTTHPDIYKNKTLSKFK